MKQGTLVEALRRSIRDLVNEPGTVAVAYSGGLDSSLIAALASETLETKCYSVVVSGSHDANTVRTSAEKEGRAVDIIILSDEDLRGLVKTAACLVGLDSPMAIAYMTPLLGVIARARETVILAGNGADELFGGYAKYLDMSDPSLQMLADLDKSLREAKALMEHASAEGKTIGFPFLSDRVRRLALSMPLEKKIRGTSRKVVLREVAKDLNLSSQDKPKRAAQYSSGVLKRMNVLAKSDGISLESWIKSLR